MTGAGAAEDAQRPAIVCKNGLRLAFLSYADHYDYWAASDKVQTCTDGPCATVDAWCSALTH